MGRRPQPIAPLLVAIVLWSASAQEALGPTSPPPEHVATATIDAARASHARDHAAVLARVAILSAGIDRIGQGYVWPLQGRISSAYGWRSISVAGNQFHGGIDVAAPTGTPVAAARGGVVVRAGWIGAYGFLVAVDHGDGWETRYAHLSRIDVAPGQRVAQGSVVGLVGSTGASTGPHLHFEIRHQGRALDPLTYLPR